METENSPYLNNSSLTFNYYLDGSLYTAPEEDSTTTTIKNEQDLYSKLGLFYKQICDILGEIVLEYQVYFKEKERTAGDKSSLAGDSSSNPFTSLQEIHMEYGIDIKQVTGGITNQLYKVSSVKPISSSNSSNELSPPSVLIRVYGANTEVIINRKTENILFAELSRCQFSPIYYGQFANGRIEGYLESKCFEPEEMGQSEYVPLIAREMSRFHSIDMKEVCLRNDISTQPCVFKCISQWLKQAKAIIEEYTSPMYVKEDYNAKNSSAEKESQTQTKIETLEERKRKSSLFTTEYISNLETELNFLEEYLLPEKSLTTKCNLITRAEEISKEIIFGHQDLLSGNILYNEKWDPPRVQFIDYEYGGYNYRIFDTINHFIEQAGFEVDVENRYPSKDTQLAFFRAYFENKSDEVLLGEGTDREKFMEEWYILCNKWVIVSHLYWGIWAIIQSKFSLIDFDFLGYSKLRLEKYYLQKSWSYDE